MNSIPDLIQKAWRMTVGHRYLIGLGTLSSFFYLIIGAARLRYFAPNPIFTTQDILVFFESNTDNPMVYLIIFGGLYLILYVGFFLTNIIVEGGLIASIAKIYLQDVRLTFGRGFALGLHSFLPLTEFRVVTNFFHIGNYILWILLGRFYMRIYMGDEAAQAMIKPLLPVFIIAGMFITIISIFLTYGEYNLVVFRQGVFRSIKKSMTLVIFHFGETLLITVLVGLIFIRAIVNVLLIIVIPGGAAYLFSHFVTFVPLSILLSVGTVVVLIGFYFVARIAGALTAFTTAVWTLTFIELESRKEYAIVPGQSDLFAVDDDEEIIVPPHKEIPIGSPQILQEPAQTQPPSQNQQGLDTTQNPQSLQGEKTIDPRPPQA